MMLLLIIFSFAQAQIRYKTGISIGYSTDYEGHHNIQGPVAGLNFSVLLGKRFALISEAENNFYGLADAELYESYYPINQEYTKPRGGMLHFINFQLNPAIRLITNKRLQLLYFGGYNYSIKKKSSIYAYKTNSDTEEKIVSFENTYAHGFNTGLELSFRLNSKVDIFMQTKLIYTYYKQLPLLPTEHNMIIGNLVGISYEFTKDE